MLCKLTVIIYCNNANISGVEVGWEHLSLSEAVLGIST